MCFNVGYSKVIRFWKSLGLVGGGEKLGFLFLKFNKGNTIVRARLGTLLNFKFRSFIRSIRKQIPYQKTNIKEQKKQKTER